LIIIIKIIKKYSTKPTSLVTMLHWKTEHKNSKARCQKLSRNIDFCIQSFQQKISMFFRIANLPRPSQRHKTNNQT
jgi:hypothetical protein